MSTAILVLVAQLLSAPNAAPEVDAPKSVCTGRKGSQARKTEAERWAATRLSAGQRAVLVCEDGARFEVSASEEE